MKKVVLIMMMAMMATVSVCAQRVISFDTPTLMRAEKLMNEGRLDESLTYFEAELKENPKNAYAHHLVTTVYMELGRYDEAMTSVEKAIKYLPQNHREMRGIAHALKAAIHSHLEEWEETIEQLTICVSLFSKDASSLNHLAVAYKQRAQMYYKSGRYDLGDKDYVKYKELIALVDAK